MYSYIRSDVNLNNIHIIGIIMMLSDNPTDGECYMLYDFLTAKIRHDSSAEHIVKYLIESTKCDSIIRPTQFMFTRNNYLHHLRTDFPPIYKKIVKNKTYKLNYFDMKVLNSQYKEIRPFLLNSINMERRKYINLPDYIKLRTY